MNDEATTSQKAASGGQLPPIYTLISQIPLEFRTPDLRNFFSHSIETEAFACFNYRHRPDKSGLFNVCVCKVRQHKFDELVALYNKKNWLNSAGMLHKSRCLIVRVKVKRDSDESSTTTKTMLSESEVDKLLEFQRIPTWMPQGNVGTPTGTFMQYINQCVMPQSLIARLGLNVKHWRKYKKRKYTNVQYKYEEEEEDGQGCQEEQQCVDVAFTAGGEKISGETDDELTIKEANERRKFLLESQSQSKSQSRENEEDEEDEDLGQELEEWERHEALHDDVTKQDRTSPYFFEHEIELKWEKGGSGLVFYTDENFWKEHEGKDFDAETADDLDVDMSVYYEPDGGDQDSRQLVEMSRLDMLRAGAGPELFEGDESLSKRVRLNPFHAWPPSKTRSERTTTTGSFERYTRGVGRRVLERCGWREGEPLGLPARSGIREALDESAGKAPRDRAGVGYFGQRVDRAGLIEAGRRRRERERRSAPFYVASKFDRDEEEFSSGADSLLRRSELPIKYREKKRERQRNSVNKLTPK